MLNRLNTQNKRAIQSLESAAFKAFGRVINGYSFDSILDTLNQHTTIPEEGNIYVASLAQLENDASKSWLTRHIYGEMPIQIGYCNGKNRHIANGLEYHKGSEVIITQDDIVLTLGHAYDITNQQYDMQLAQLFYLPAKSAVEIYAHTLHLSPIRLSDAGFKSIIVLPLGTNTPLAERNVASSPEDALLLETNKWMLAHPQSTKLIARHAHVGLVGENIILEY